MALSRKYLQGMGLTEEQVSAIIEANEETISGLKDKIEQFQTAGEKSEKKLAEVQKELDELKEASDTSKPYKKKYEDEVASREKIQKEFDDYKADIEAKESMAKKSNAYKKLLKDAGVSEKRLDSILKVSQFKDIEFDENGAVKDADKLTESIKTEWADFIVEKGVQGVPVAHPIVNKQSEKKVSRASELVAKYHANLYGEAPKKGE